VSKGMEMPGMDVIPVCLPGFKFPSSVYFDEVLPSVWPGGLQKAQHMVQCMFRRIAIYFSIDAADDVLDVQARSVLERVPTKRFEARRENKSPRYEMQTLSTTITVAAGSAPSGGSRSARTTVTGSTPASRASVSSAASKSDIADGREYAEGSASATEGTPLLDALPVHAQKKVTLIGAVHGVVCDAESAVGSAPLAKVRSLVIGATSTMPVASPTSPSKHSRHQSERNAHAGSPEHSPKPTRHKSERLAERRWQLRPAVAEHELKDESKSPRPHIGSKRRQRNKTMGPPTLVEPGLRSRPSAKKTTVKSEPPDSIVAF